jgi:hypothetical protein
MALRELRRWWNGRGERRRLRRWRTDQPVDVVVTHAEVNGQHGTGVLLERLFGAAPDLVFLRARDDYDGRQRAGAFGLRLRVTGAATDRDRREVARAAVTRALRGITVRRVLAVPYHPEDVCLALALADAGAPLATWIMDDRTLEVAGIADALLAELLSRSALRLAISPELRDAYRARYGLPLAFVPPVVDPRWVLLAPRLPSPAALAAPRGVMLGNVWGRGWLAQLQEVVAGSGVAVDWYARSDLRWHAADAEDLAAAGIHRRQGPPDAVLVALLRAAPFAVLPTGTLDAADDHRAVARYSLPSKAVYAAAAAHLPTIVVGHPDTAAARFVAGHGLGVVVPYRSGPFRAAVAELCRPEAQLRIRARAAALAPACSAAGVTAWLWASLAACGPADDRFERAFGCDAGPGPAQGPSASRPPPAPQGDRLDPAV